MRGEPEAVPASYQRRLADQAHRREQERLLNAWVETAEAIDVALTDFAAVAAGDRRVQNGLEAVRRAAAALGKRVTASKPPESGTWLPSPEASNFLRASQGSPRIPGIAWLGRSELSPERAAPGTRREGRSAPRDR